MAAVPRPWTDAESAELRQLHGQGLPLNQIRKAMGRPMSTVSRHARAMGLSFDRTQTAAATDASSFDRKATRARIIEKLYRAAEGFTDRAVASDGFDMLVNIGMGEQAPRRLEFAPASEIRALAGAASTLLARAEALEKVDADGGAAEVRGLVGTLMLNLETMGASLPPVDTDIDQ